MAAEDAAEFGAWTGYGLPNDRRAWHPLVVRLLDYWRSIAPAPGRLPGRQHLVPEDIAPLWSRLWMFDVVRSALPQMPLRYRYRFCGSELVRAFGREVTGRWLDEAQPQLAADQASRDRLRFTATTGEPTWRRGPPPWTRNPDLRTIESCIVPLASDGVVVDKLLGVAVAFDAAGREM